ncbi:MAG: hypothetical protein AAGG48_17545 [Planctomycetota bacterium]
MPKFNDRNHLKHCKNIDLEIDAGCLRGQLATTFDALNQRGYGKKRVQEIVGVPYGTLWNYRDRPKSCFMENVTLLWFWHEANQDPYELRITPIDAADRIAKLLHQIGISKHPGHPTFLQRLGSDIATEVGWYEIDLELQCRCDSRKICAKYAAFALANFPLNQRGEIAARCEQANEQFLSNGSTKAELTFHTCLRNPLSCEWNEQLADHDKFFSHMQDASGSAFQYRQNAYLEHAKIIECLRQPNCNRMELSLLMQEHCENDLLRLARPDSLSSGTNATEA